MEPKFKAQDRKFKNQKKVQEKNKLIRENNAMVESKDFEFEPDHELIVKVCAKKRNSSEYGSPNYEGEEVQDDVC
jgi:hypothetical protein